MSKAGRVAIVVVCMFAASLLGPSAALASHPPTYACPNNVNVPYVGSVGYEADTDIAICLPGGSWAWVQVFNDGTRNNFVSAQDCTAMSSSFVCAGVSSGVNMSYANDQVNIYPPRVCVFDPISRDDVCNFTRVTFGYYYTERARVYYLDVFTCPIPNDGYSGTICIPASRIFDSSDYIQFG